MAEGCPILYTNEQIKSFAPGCFLRLQEQSCVFSGKRVRVVVLT